MAPISVVGPTFFDLGRLHGDGCMEPDLTKGHDVRGLTPLRGTWIAVAIMSPVVVAQIAFALPDLFAGNAPDEAVAIAYESATERSTPSEMTPDWTDATARTVEDPADQIDDPSVTQLPELTDESNSECLARAVEQPDPGKGEPQNATGEPECTEAEVSDEHDSSEVSKESTTKRAEAQDEADKERSDSDDSKKSKNPKKPKKPDDDSDASDKEHDKSDD